MDSFVPFIRFKQIFVDVDRRILSLIYQDGTDFYLMRLLPQHRDAAVEIHIVTMLEFRIKWLIADT